jgi:replicative DNA helicase
MQQTLDVEAMRALVGEASINAENARRLLDETSVTADDLENQAFRPLWLIFEDRIRARRGMDVVTIRDALAKAGAAPTLLEVASEVLFSPHHGHAFERLSLLHEKAVRRRVVAALREVATQTVRGLPLPEIEALMRNVPVHLRTGATRVRSAAGSAMAILDEYEQAWSGKRPPLLQTGSPEFDQRVSLIHNLLVIGARPGAGKSALVAGLVDNWTRAGKRVGVLCYEDTERDLEYRLLALASGTRLAVARADVEVPVFAQDALSDALREWSKREHLLLVDDARPRGSPADVISSLRRMRDMGAEVVMLDNMTGVRMDASEDKFSEVGDLLGAIRDEAQSLRLPCIVVGHLKRQQGEDEATRPPRLSDFSNSNQWDNHSRLALGAWVEGDKRFLRVLKQTNGPAWPACCDFELGFADTAAVVTSINEYIPPPPPPKPERAPKAARQRELAEAP